MVFESSTFEKTIEKRNKTVFIDILKQKLCECSIFVRFHLYVNFEWDMFTKHWQSYMYRQTYR